MRARSARRAAAAALCVAGLAFWTGCSKKTPPPPDAGAPAPVAIDGHAVVQGACLSCHTEQMLQQQRLTEAQWTKEVTKMTSWGANLDAVDTPALIAYLSANYGPDAGAYVATIAPADELDPSADGIFAGGDPERGHGVYAEKCSACHGADARGQIGVNLVDKPFLYRADDFAEAVRRGRGKMPAQRITDPQFADILAYLRRLR